jgi:hypothetical protein
MTTLDQRVINEIKGIQGDQLNKFSAITPNILVSLFTTLAGAADQIPPKDKVDITSVLKPGVKKEKKDNFADITKLQSGTIQFNDLYIRPTNRSNTNAESIARRMKYTPDFWVYKLDLGIIKDTITKELTDKNLILVIGDTTGAFYIGPESLFVSKEKPSRIAEAIEREDPNRPLRTPEQQAQFNKNDRDIYEPKRKEEAAAAAEVKQEYQKRYAAAKAERAKEREAAEQAVRNQRIRNAKSKSNQKEKDTQAAAKQKAINFFTSKKISLNNPEVVKRIEKAERIGLFTPYNDNAIEEWKSADVKKKAKNEAAPTTDEAADLAAALAESEVEDAEAAAAKAKAEEEADIAELGGGGTKRKRHRRSNKRLTKKKR